jgi:hypothetical protein
MMLQDGSATQTAQAGVAQDGAGPAGKDAVRMLDPLVAALDRALARQRAQTPEPVEPGM